MPLHDSVPRSETERKEGEGVNQTRNSRPSWRPREERREERYRRNRVEEGRSRRDFVFFPSSFFLPSYGVSQCYFWLHSFLLSLVIPSLSLSSLSLLPYTHLRAQCVRVDSRKMSMHFPERDVYAFLQFLAHPLARFQHYLRIFFERCDIN